jgi:hypothetical protein
MSCVPSSCRKVTFLCSCSSADERLVRRPLGDRDERALGRTDPTAYRFNCIQIGNALAIF